MVRSPEARPLNNRLNLDDKVLQCIDGRVEYKHQALAHPFGDSSVGSTQILRTRELLMNNLKWNQYWFVNALEVVADFQWQPVLEWLSDHPYALLVGDVQLFQNGGKREKITDKDTVLKEEAEKKEPVKEWIGPHRYDANVKIMDQRSRATEEGINCQVAVHVALETLGIPISREERSGELYENYRRFDPTTEQLEIGDIVFFYEKNAIQDARSLHVTIVAGFDMADVPLLLHATNQPVKTRPAAEVIPIAQLLTNRQRYCYGAVRVPTHE